MKKIIIRLFLILVIFICGYGLATLLGAQNSFLTTRDLEKTEVKSGEESKEINDIAGKWKIDYVKDKNGENVPLREVFGTGLNTATDALLLNEDNTYSKYIGIYADEKDVTGTYTVINGKKLVLKNGNNVEKELNIQLQENSLLPIIIEDIADEYEVVYKKVEELKEVDKETDKELDKELDKESDKKESDKKESDKKEKDKKESDKKEDVKIEPKTELSKTDKLFKDLISKYEGKVYEDSWKKYDIKLVKDIKTEYVLTNDAKTGELYKCELTYVATNGKTNTIELAMIKDLNTGKAELMGTYENFTGTTTFVNFVGKIESGENEEVKNSDEGNKKTQEDDVIYEFVSGDNAAVNGKPETLYIYKLDENKISFKYHASWNENDIKGTAISTEKNIYVYENGNKKIEIELYSMGEDSLKVTEYENGEITTFKTLWK